MKRWILRLGLRLGDWLTEKCNVAYCVHCAKRPAVAPVPYAGQNPNDFAQVVGMVCLECLHKPMPNVLHAMEEM